MAQQFDIQVHTSREISAELVNYLAALADFYGGGYIRLGYPLELPSIPACVLDELSAKLDARGLGFSISHSDVFAEGAGI